MRKIVYIFLAADIIDTVFLDACSPHSSLVEPMGERELLLDLSPFNRIGDVLNLLASTLSGLIKGKAGIGVAASPLLAMLAARRRSLAAEAKSSCRSFKKKGIHIIQVIPGQEPLFMRTLPLEEFTPLSARESKLLKRLGYSRVGDLAELGSARLKQILKRDASTLWQNSCGRDYRPVRGLYPPGRLGYSLVVEEGCRNRNQLLLILKEAARELSGLLIERHVSWHHVELQLELSSGQSLRMKRQLSLACHEGSSLRMILAGLLPDIIEQPVIELKFFLRDLKPLEMRAQYLFTLRYTC